MLEVGEAALDETDVLSDLKLLIGYPMILELESGSRVEMSLPTTKSSFLHSSIGHDVASCLRRQPAAIHISWLVGTALLC